MHKSFCPLVARVLNFVTKVRTCDRRALVRIDIQGKFWPLTGYHSPCLQPMTGRAKYYGQVETACPKEPAPRAKEIDMFLLAV